MSAVATRRARQSTVFRVAAIAAVATAAIDAVLLQRKTNFFTGGFLSEHHLTGFWPALLFVVLCVVCDAAFTVPLAALGAALSRRLRLSIPAGVLLQLFFAAAPLLIATFVSYQLWTYIGDAANLGLLFQLTGRHISELFAVGAQSVLAAFTSISVIVVALALVTWFVHRRTRGSGSWADAPHATASAVRAIVLVVIVAVGVVAAAALRAGTYDYGLRHTASGQFIGSAINRLSDVDRDGYGIFWFPRDPSPLKSAIHPYAVDVPGDGIDQDGVAGDLPASAAVYREPPPPAGAWPHAPSVILIVLESVRADAVGATSDGKEVTPNLDALARSGVSVPLAYSHNGYTIQSRFHILSGSLANLRGGTTLLDDFHARGYETAYFSAQDESFGDSPIDFRSADVFYDARSDRARRFSAYTTPGSLAVPYTVVEERVTAFLAHRRTDRPVFLYVNFQDTHFPYHHASMQPLISSVVLSPSQMTAPRGDDLKRMYLNAVANVDGAIGRVLAAARTSLGDPGVVVMSDHGESLFDAGFLGHGYALNDVQTRIPMIVSGLPMRIAQPFGQVALRDALAAALQRMGPGASRTPTLENSGSRVFQYLGTIDRPAEVGWTTSAGRTVYDFRTDSFDAGAGFHRTGALAGAERDGFQRLVQYWESMRWAASRAADGR